jgi:hypothetical protein
MDQMDSNAEDSQQAPRPQPAPKLLDRARRLLRLLHYSIHTERSYLEWIVRFVRFHQMRSREELFPAEPKIEEFLTHLARQRNRVREKAPH